MGVEKIVSNVEDEMEAELEGENKIELGLGERGTVINGDDRYTLRLQSDIETRGLSDLWIKF